MRFKSRTRALAASALAASLGLAGLALTAPSATAAEQTEVVRVSGPTRYGTAVEAAETGFPGGATDAVLASGQKFPDALAAGGLAGTLDAPILLTPQGDLDDTTLTGLEDLDASTVTIVGGPDAVSLDVELELEAEGFTVERIAGANRFDTAADIAAEVGGTTAVLANGFRFPDALAISPGAHELELPVLLTGADELAAEAASYIDDANVDEVLIVGGVDVVSQEIEDGLEADGIDVTRLAGGDRYDTAVEIAEFHLANGFSADELVLATGENFADALSGGPMASQLLAPMVLTQTDVLTRVTESFIHDVAPAADTIYVLGGPAAVSSGVADAAAEAAVDDSTPAVVETATAADVAGEDDQVVVVFDQAVQGDGTYTVSDGTTDLEYAVASGEDTDTLVLAPVAAGADFDDFDENDYTLTFSDEIDVDGTSADDGTIDIDESGANAEGLEPEQTRVVSADTLRAYATIQAAIDAEDTADVGGSDRLEAYSADGDPFDELVTVSKDGITIVGNAADGSGLADLSGTFLVAGVSDVTIEGFAISGFDVVQSVTSGFYLDDVEGLELRDNLVTGDGPDGEDKGVINSNNSAVEEAVIVDNTFTGLRQGTFANPSADLTVQDNVFEGNGYGSANDADSVITGNTFVDNAFEGVGLGSDGTTVTGNTFEGDATAYVCDYTTAYDMAAVASANTFPDGRTVQDDDSSPDCIVSTDV
ncbi:MAG TPA: hypothetical protein DCS55_02640 [Acidimicrobiaceae bacterium]|nr:hypothetical protein [Acidimicrobiaceae bacterium]